MLNPDMLDRTIPRPALVLGLGGLIPFLALPVMGYLETPVALEAAVRVLEVYAAVILSFMGGVHWGLAMKPVPPQTKAGWAEFTISVVPALVAWGSFILPDRPQLLTLATAFAMLLAYDAWATRRGSAPGWYPRFRLMLTVVVVSMLCATAAFVI